MEYSMTFSIMGHLGLYPPGHRALMRGRPFQVVGCPGLAPGWLTFVSTSAAIFGRQDAPGLPRGASRWFLPYSQRETPRGKPGASQARGRRLSLETSLTNPGTSPGDLNGLCYF